ncbi:MAG TPA: GtrA family protein [Candidatus Limnocylindrales bacterium]
MTVVSLRLLRPQVSRARFGQAARFLLVGLSGVVVNQFLLVFLTASLGIHYLVSAVLATQGSTTWNFLGNERWAFAGRRFAGPVWARYIGYSAINNGSLILRIPLLWAFTELLHVGYAWSNLATLVVLFVGRYLVADGWIWRAKADPAAVAGEDGVVGGAGSSALVAVGPGLPAPYRYDIAGILFVTSETELPELAAFRTEALGQPDIRITIARVGSLPGRRIALSRDGDSVRYVEHLGALGANFRVTMGSPIEVEASPLLALSRHVLYTNVLEALLRFVLVSKGYVLLHSACIAKDGRAALLSAQTDTGKTSTVIRLVRDRGYQFLSDDMTIIDPRGVARHFPKPMTLSYHTMHSIRGDEIPARQRAALAVQSRIHSKSGRSFGKTLGTLNIPIMSVNSVVQIAVPPPKHHIDRLVECEMLSAATIEHVFLMERGDALRERVALDDALGQLIDNTDDAYGFPPFSSFAPQIRIGDDDYAALRRRESELLATALQGAEIWRLRVPGHEWAELLPSIIEAPRPVDEREPVAIPIVPDVPAQVSIELPIEVPLGDATT